MNVSNKVFEPGDLSVILSPPCRERREQVHYKILKVLSYANPFSRHNIKRLWKKSA
jgi:hypothetical protein